MDRLLNKFNSCSAATAPAELQNWAVIETAISIKYWPVLWRLTASQLPEYCNGYEPKPAHEIWISREVSSKSHSQNLTELTITYIFFSRCLDNKIPSRGKEHVVRFLHDPGMLWSTSVATIEGFLYVTYTYNYVFQKVQASPCHLKYNLLIYCLNLIFGTGWQKWMLICLLSESTVKSSLEVCEQNHSQQASYKSLVYHHRENLYREDEGSQDDGIGDKQKSCIGNNNINKDPVLVSARTHSSLFPTRPESLWYHHKE